MRSKLTGITTLRLSAIEWDRCAEPGVRHGRCASSVERRLRSEMGEKGLNAEASNVLDPESEIILYKKGEIDMGWSEG